MNSMNYIGLDIHKKSISCCVRQSDGTIIQEWTRVAPSSTGECRVAGGDQEGFPFTKGPSMGSESQPSERRPPRNQFQSNLYGPPRASSER